MKGFCRPTAVIHHAVSGLCRRWPTSPPQPCLYIYSAGTARTPSGLMNPGITACFAEYRMGAACLYYWLLSALAPVVSPPLPQQYQWVSSPMPCGRRQRFVTLVFTQVRRLDRHDALANFASCHPQASKACFVPTPLIQIFFTIHVLLCSNIPSGKTKVPRLYFQRTIFKLFSTDHYTREDTLGLVSILILCLISTNKGYVYGCTGFNGCRLAGALCRIALESRLCLGNL